MSQLFLGPFGCLNYLILTKEQRLKKGLLAHWGVRGIPGIYLGCEVNPTTLVHHHFITDETTVFASSNRIKVVADVSPMKIAATPARQMNNVIPEDDEEDEHVNAVLTADENEIDIDCQEFVAIVRDVVIERQLKAADERVFLGKYSGLNEKHSKGIRKRDMTYEERRSRPIKKRGSKIVTEGLNEKGECGQRTIAECLIEAKGLDAENNLENPADFEITSAPDAHRLQEPYNGAKYFVAVPSHIDDEGVLPIKAEHPHHQFVKRKVRRRFKVMNHLKKEISKAFDGKVTKFYPRRALFRINYSDGDWEEVDFEELQDILIMSVEYEDAAEEAGKTNKELREKFLEHLLQSWDITHEGQLDRFLGVHFC